MGKTMTEEDARTAGGEPVPGQRPDPQVATCPCGYSEVVVPRWMPYQDWAGWNPAWYYGVKCPVHGWSSRLLAIHGRRTFRAKADDILE
jgi:hypothetical protein